MNESDLYNIKSYVTYQLSALCTKTAKLNTIASISNDTD